MATDVLIRVLARSQQAGVCRGCKRRIVWMETLNGKRMPMNAHALPKHIGDDGVAMYSADDAHWASCPDRVQFDKRAHSRA